MTFLFATNHIYYKASFVYRNEGLMSVNMLDDIRVKREFTTPTGAPITIEQVDGTNAWVDIRFHGFDTRKLYVTGISSFDSAIRQLSEQPARLCVRPGKGTWWRNGNRLNASRPEIAMYAANGSHTPTATIIAMQLVFGRGRLVYPTF